MTWKDRKRFTEVLGHRMAHVEHGEGDPVLFLHGNPTSSYLWRDVMAAMDGSGRLVAPDLIGCGDSDKLADSGPDRYKIAEHARFLEAWIAAVIPEGRITLVIHDWGGALGFDWARRHADRVNGIVYMETIVRPMAWDEWPEPVRGIFQGLRSDAGEDMILKKNVFVERILPGSILRDLTDAEMEEYRRPFAQIGEARRPTLTFPRQIPLGGEPADVVAMARAYCDWLCVSEVPKLFIDADPGAILTGPMRETALSFPNQTVARVAGSHFIQEDSGAEIGRAIAGWLSRI